MCAQLCRFLHKLQSVRHTRILIGSLNKQLHLHSGLLKENQLNATANEAVKPDLHKQKKGLDKTNPVMVASSTNKVIVGCNCAPDDPTLKWFYLEDGPAQVCDCGVYFKLDRVKEGTPIPEYSHVMQVDPNLEDLRRERTGMPFASTYSNKRTLSQK